MITKQRKILALAILILAVIITVIKMPKEETEPNEEIKTTQILLYFINEENEIKEEYRYVPLEEIKENMIETLIKEIAKGPEDETLKEILSKDTYIEEVQIRENTLEIKLSNTPENETKKEALIKTLTQIKEIENVEIK